MAGDIEDKTVTVEEVHKEVALTPISLIDKAITLNADIDKLEKLMDLEERWQRNKARRAFDEAMMNFQSECPIIKRIKEGGVTKSGEVAYFYAPLEYIVQETKPFIAKNGFSYLIKTEFGEGKVTAICTVRHVEGHSEESRMEVPMLRQTGVMSDAQVVAATTTFAKRYAFCNAFGIMTMEDDTDAIDTETTERFNEILKHWDIKDKLIAIANGLSSKNAFNQFMQSLPNVEQLTKLKEHLSKIDKQYHPKLWQDFQTQTATSADSWLDKLSKSKLIKQE